MPYTLHCWKPIAKKETNKQKKQKPWHSVFGKGRNYKDVGNSNKSKIVSQKKIMGHTQSGLNVSFLLKIEMSGNKQTTNKEQQTTNNKDKSAF